MSESCPKCGMALASLNKPAGFGVETMQCIGCHAQWLVKPPGPDPKRFMRIGPGVGEVIQQELHIAPTPIYHAEDDATFARRIAIDNEYTIQPCPTKRRLCSYIFELERKLKRVVGDGQA